MAKYQVQHNPFVNQIFDDLEKLQTFCVDYGYKYDEADLYNPKSVVFKQFTKYATGKNVKNMWEIDAKKD